MQSLALILLLAITILVFTGKFGLENRHDFGDGFHYTVPVVAMA